MPKSLRWFINKMLLKKDETIKNLTNSYMEKAKNNIITMELLSKVTNFRDILELPFNYDPNEWVVIAAYYSMYIAALSVLTKLGYKSKNHSATIQVLEEYFVKKSLLDKSSFLSLKNAILQKEELEKLSEVKHKKEIAQYSVTKKTTKEIASKIKQDAYSFTGKVELIIKQLK